MATKVLFIVAAIVMTVVPQVTAGLALLIGMLIGLTGHNPFPDAKKWTSQLLGICLVGLGAKLSLGQITEVGISGMTYTIISIAGTFALGMAMARFINVDMVTAILITTGTAICGGSAIAAISPIIQADANRISIAMATVFILNAIALYIFPPFGHWLGMNGTEFGLWGALAIHDTSSVVGAAMAFGDGSLEIATTVKLARALWIMPLAFTIYAIRRLKYAGEKGKVNTYPLIFVIGFVGMSALFTYVEFLQPAAEPMSYAARRGLVLVLFLIGASLSMDKLKSVGVKSLGFGAALWGIVGSVLLVSVLQGWIS